MNEKIINGYDDDYDTKDIKIIIMMNNMMMMINNK